MGVGVGYAHNYIHEKKGFGHINVDQGAIVLYGTLSRKKWYCDVASWGGYYHLHNIRKIHFPGFSGRPKSKTNGWQLAPHLELGYGYFKPNSLKRSSWAGFEPFTMLDWVSTWEHGLKERGTGVLDFGQKGRWCSLLRSESGIRFNEMFYWCWGRLIVREKVSYAYQKTFSTGKITAYLIGSPGSFTVSMFTHAQQLCVTEMELFFSPGSQKYPQVSIAYQGEFGSNYHLNQIMATVGMDF